jgi:hypothetical protein
MCILIGWATGGMLNIDELGTLTNIMDASTLFTGLQPTASRVVFNHREVCTCMYMCMYACLQPSWTLTGLQPTASRVVFNHREVCTCIYVRMCACVYVCMCACMNVFCVCMDVKIRQQLQAICSIIHTYIHTYILFEGGLCGCGYSIHAYMHTYVYIYIYIGLEDGLYVRGYRIHTCIHTYIYT